MNISIFFRLYCFSVTSVNQLLFLPNIRSDLYNSICTISNLYNFDVRLYNFQFDCIIRLYKFDCTNFYCTNSIVQFQCSIVQFRFIQFLIRLYNSMVQIRMYCFLITLVNQLLFLSNIRFDFIKNHLRL